MILIFATDGSDSSMEAVNLIKRTFPPQAIDELVVATVDELQVTEFHYTTVHEDWQLTMTRNLDDAADRLAKAGFNTRRVYLKGKPATEIVKLAGELNADMLVVGSHGRKGFQRLMLGSVSEALVREAPCPVLVARPKGPSQ